MASTGHIFLGNHVINHTKGSAPTSAPGHGLDLYLRNLGPVAYGGRTLGTARGGCIPEFTYVGGPGPSLIAIHGQDFHPRSQTVMAHVDLARGMAHGGHILLGNLEIAQTNGTTLVIGSYPIWTRHVVELGPIIETHPEQRLRLWNLVSQGAHEQ